MDRAERPPGECERAPLRRLRALAQPPGSRRQPGRAVRAEPHPARERVRSALRRDDDDEMVDHDVGAPDLGLKCLGGETRRRAQIRRAQFASTSDSPGGGSRNGTRCRSLPTGLTLVDCPATATSIGAEPTVTPHSTFCAGTGEATILSQHCRAPSPMVLEGAAATLGQQHDVRAADPQRMNSNPSAAPDASSAGARRAAMTLLFRRARIPIGNARPMPFEQQEEWLPGLRNRATLALEVGTGASLTRSLGAQPLCSRAASSRLGVRAGAGASRGEGGDSGRARGPCGREEASQESATRCCRTFDRSNKSCVHPKRRPRSRCSRSGGAR